jgi:hypothetical protein
MVLIHFRAYIATTVVVAVDAMAKLLVARKHYRVDHEIAWAWV